MNRFVKLSERNTKILPILRIASVFIIIFSAFSGQAQSLIPELSFKEPVLKTGRGFAGKGEDGAVYIFENVGWGVDALVRIQGRSSDLVTLSDIDIKGPEESAASGLGFVDAWQPRIKYADGTAPANTSWWMEFKISFVRHSNRSLPIAVNQFFVTGLDIDGDGNQLHEFQTYYKVQSFTLESQTAIFASTVTGIDLDPMLQGKRFDGPTTNYPGLVYSAEDAMVSNYYTGSNSMVVRLGAQTEKEGTVSANRMYGLLFKSLAFGAPVRKKAPLYLIASNGERTLREQ